MTRVVGESGSAEAATSPSHGLNGFQAGSVTNGRDGITPPGKAASSPSNFEEAYNGLEDFICTTQLRMNVLCRLAYGVHECERGKEYVRVPVLDLDCLLFMIEDTRRALGVLDKHYQDFWSDEAAAIAEEKQRLAQANDVRLQDNKTIAELIVAHRQAEREFGDALIEDEQKRAGGDSPETVRLQAAREAETVARQRILAWHPRSLGASSDRLNYLLFDPDGPWHGTIPTNAELHEFARSMVEPI